MVPLGDNPSCFSYSLEMTSPPSLSPFSSYHKKSLQQAGASSAVEKILEKFTRLFPEQRQEKKILPTIPEALDAIIHLPAHTKQKRMGSWGR